MTLGEEKEEKEGEEGWWREKIFSENLIGGESSSFLIAKYYKTQVCLCLFVFVCVCVCVCYLLLFVRGSGGDNCDCRSIA